MPTWIQGEIVENKLWCTDLFSLKIKTDPLTFKAGQFALIGLDIDDKLVHRPYSLVNTPQDALLEIHFNTFQKSFLTSKLADLVTGDTIQLSDRLNGLLTLDQVPDVPHLWLFATGTGIGPFLSILKTAEPWQRFEKIILCYSAKTVENMAYRDDFEKMLSQYPDQFCFVPFVTREKSADTINSRITTYLKSGELEKHVGLTLAPELSHLMLCGVAQMLDEVTQHLDSKGLHRHTRREPGHIATEKYY